jgi:hypothetical protein
MKDKVKSMSNKMGSAPYHDATPPRMSRSVGSGKGGNNWKIPSNAKYGTDGIGGDEPTRMSRSVGKGKSGNSWGAPPAAGPGRMPRSAKGSASHQGKSYGVGGVSLKENGGRYGV